MKIDDEKLYTALKERGVDVSKLDSLMEDAKSRNTSLYNLSEEQHVLSDKDFTKLNAELLGLPFVDLPVDIEKKVLKVVPEGIALKYNIAAFKIDKDKNEIHLATNDPQEAQMVIHDIEKKTGLKAVVYLTTARHIKDALGQYTTELKKIFFSLIPQKILELADREADMDIEKFDSLKEEFSIVDLFDAIMLHAFRQKASDIHIEAYRKSVVLRYRIDGVLHEIARFPKMLHSLLVTRCKILSNLRIDEARAAQDGRIKAALDKEDVVFRVSILPTHYGEKVVMRLLRDIQDSISLEEGGISESDYQKIINNSKKAYGMLLITGPTGSGKTTTLYSVIKLLNRPNVNISTVEDPIEYGIEGVNQTQVNPVANLTFATGLRSLLRQDPDIILVGEIRDKDTAQIAIESAMTGHLVLSTLHANTSSIAVPRLIEMGIEPFLLASAINVIVAQRLVRTLCDCKQLKQYSAEMLAIATGDSDFPKTVDSVISKMPLALQNTVKQKNEFVFYESKGCEKCGQTGYKGRLGIYEVLEADEEMKKAILSGANALEIETIARHAGMTTLLEDGLAKALNGRTSIAEVIRVLKA